MWLMCLSPGHCALWRGLSNCRSNGFLDSERTIMAMRWQCCREWKLTSILGKKANVYLQSPFTVQSLRKRASLFFRWQSILNRKNGAAEVHKYEGQLARILAKLELKKEKKWRQQSKREKQETLARAAAERTQKEGQDFKALLKTTERFD